MTDELVHLEVSGGVGTITLDSPSRTLFGELKILHKLTATLADDLNPNRPDLSSVRFVAILRRLERLAGGTLHEAIKLKMKYNAGRPAMHGKTI